MGMDVYGKKPSSKEGEYFRSSIWQWRPIIAFMCLAGCNVPKEWSFNDGDGLRSQDACNQMADKIEAFLKVCDDSDLSLPAPMGIGVDENGVFGKGTKTPYYTNREHVEKWITFLRHCGGFEIK